MQYPCFFDSVAKTLAEQLFIPLQTMTQLQYDKVYDRCLGTLFGAFFGDSLGSYCEKQTNITDDMIQKAMQMRGGGIYNTKRGQLTDDGEMALHLLYSLLQYDKQKTFQQSYQAISLQLARQNLKWICSRPFDLSNTFHSNIQSIYKNDGQLSMQNLQYALNHGQMDSTKTMSNGFLMRCTPMAIFTALMKKYKKQDFQKIDKLLRTQVKMTHTYFECGNIGIGWQKLIADIILRDQQIQDLQPILKKFLNQPRSSTFQQWIDLAKKERFPPNGSNPYQGKIAFSIAIIYFIKIVQRITYQHQLTPQLYRQIIANIIRHGGTTGTNACITGGLLGSIWGFRRLPNQYKHYQMNLNLKKGKQIVDRGKFYEPKNGLYNVTLLFIKFIKKDDKKKQQKKQQKEQQKETQKKQDQKQTQNYKLKQVQSKNQSKTQNIQIQQKNKEE